MEEDSGERERERERSPKIWYLKAPIAEQL